VDLVKRSTRFVSSVPAADILMGIEDVVCSGAAPRPCHLANLAQETLVSWDEYRLDVRWGSALAYSVHVFLLPDVAPTASSLPSYMVEFRRRSQMDIFQFKRYYEGVLEELGRHMKHDKSALSFSASGVPARA